MTGRRRIVQGDKDIAPPHGTTEIAISANTEHRVTVAARNECIEFSVADDAVVLDR